MTLTNIRCAGVRGVPCSCLGTLQRSAQGSHHHEHQRHSRNRQPLLADETARCESWCISKLVVKAELFHVRSYFGAVGNSLSSFQSSYVFMFLLVLS